MAEELVERSAFGLVIGRAIRHSDAPTAYQFHPGLLPAPQRSPDTAGHSVACGCSGTRPRPARRLSPAGPFPPAPWLPCPGSYPPVPARPAHRPAVRSSRLPAPAFPARSHRLTVRGCSHHNTRGKAPPENASSASPGESRASPCLEITARFGVTPSFASKGPTQSCSSASRPRPNGSSYRPLMK